MGKIFETAGAEARNQVPESDQTGKPLWGDPQLVEEQPLEAADVEAEIRSEFIDLESSAMTIQERGRPSAARIPYERRAATQQLFHDQLP